MARKSWATAWIVGASTGIGAEAAQKLAAEGVKVTISARSADKLTDLAAGNENIIALPLDMTDYESCKAAVESFETLPDLIILNAAIYEPMTVATFNAAKANHLMAVNYGGVVNLLDLILPKLTARESGHVAIVASINGFVGLPVGTAYGPTKAALHNLAEAMKPELDLYNVTISVVNPGFVKTPLTSGNKFKMPQLLEAGDAAARMIKGLRTGRYEVIFPYPFAGFVKLLGDLPRGVLFAFTRGMVSRPKKKKNA